jgi:hypothetical protein
MKVTIGCDPELFVTKDGKFRSAYGLVPGTKENPHKVEYGAVQVDGMALEFNIDPVDNVDDFVKYNKAVMTQLKDMVPGYEFAIVPSCRFNGNHFRAQPDEAKELGCTPDYNAWTMRENPKPNNKTTMRTASGHIHIGFCEDADPQDADHMLRCAILVKQLDCFLGLPSVLFDKDSARRSMYGAAGAFRPKPYGVEYRVLSNAWLLSEERMRFVYNQTVSAVDYLVRGVRPFDNIGEATIRNIINCSNTLRAELNMENFVPNGVATVAEAKKLAVIAEG